MYGGNPRVVIATPEIDVYPLSPDLDYIMLGSDGIFDHLENS